MAAASITAWGKKSGRGAAAEAGLASVNKMGKSLVVWLAGEEGRVQREREIQWRETACFGEGENEGENEK